MPTNYEPYPKNPDIARIFIQIGYSEELGTGVLNVFKFSEDYSNSDKIIFSDNDIFVTEVPLKEMFDVNDTINDTINYEKKILNLITENNHITTTKPATKLNVSRSTIARIINRLQEQNIILRVGSKKTGYWEFTE